MINIVQSNRRKKVGFKMVTKPKPEVDFRAHLKEVWVTEMSANEIRCYTSMLEICVLIGRLTNLPFRFFWFTEYSYFQIPRFGTFSTFFSKVQMPPGCDHSKPYSMFLLYTPLYKTCTDWFHHINCPMKLFVTFCQILEYCESALFGLDVLFYSSFV